MGHFLFYMKKTQQFLDGMLNRGIVLKGRSVHCKCVLCPYVSYNKREGIMKLKMFY